MKFRLADTPACSCLDRALFFLSIVFFVVNGAIAASSETIAVGNSLITRKFTQENHQISTTPFESQMAVRVVSTGFALDCLTGSDEVVVNRLHSTLEKSALSSSHTGLVVNWTSKLLPLAVEVHYQADARLPYIFKWLEITNRGAQPVRIVHATLESLRFTQGGEPMRGGIGQPVFLHNKFFLGIEQPAAADEVLGRNVVLSQYSDTVIASHATWRSARAVLGAVVGNHESVEDAFRRYLMATTGRRSVYRSIYCDWAAHDELGTLIKPQLTVQLTNSMLDVLQSMKSRDGIQFANYLMDAFWFAPRGAYITFKKPNWPQGFGSALKRMLALGMKPGLWFDVSCAPHADGENMFIDLKNTPGWHGPAAPCLSDPEFTQFLTHAMAFHIRKHDLRMLKFDFANMLCRHEDPCAPSLAILEKNSDALLRVTQKLRQLNPAIVIRAYNGFSSGDLMGSTKYYDQVYALSPWWLRWFDTVYSGDPRPADVPSFTDLRDSIVWYQDQQVRNYMRALMPPATIDDSGTLVGKTSTIYYLGAQGFTDSWIMNIMRGNLAPEFYGDLRLLTGKDRKFMAGTMDFLQAHQKLLAGTRPILGIPGQGQVYGYCTAGKDLAFVTVVNPGLSSQSFAAEAPSLPAGSLQKLVFSNDGEHHEPMQLLNAEIQGTLVPGEIRVYALGTQRKLSSLALPPASTRQYHQVTSFESPFKTSRNASIEVTPKDVGKTLAFVIQYRKNNQPDRSYAMPEDVTKVFGSIDSHPVTFTSIPAAGTDIWSRCSWAVFKHHVAVDEANKTLRLMLAGNPPAGTQFQVQGLWLK